MLVFDQLDHLWEFSIDVKIQGMFLLSLTLSRCEQESIPVGCIPAACWLYVRWPPLVIISWEGGYPAPRHTHPPPNIPLDIPNPWTYQPHPLEGTWDQAYHPQKGPGTRDTPMNRLTDTCDTATVAGGNKPHRAMQALHDVILWPLFYNLQ